MTTTFDARLAFPGSVHVRRALDALRPGAVPEGPSADSRSGREVPARPEAGRHLPPERVKGWRRMRRPYLFLVEQADSAPVVRRLAGGGVRDREG